MTSEECRYYLLLAKDLGYEERGIWGQRLKK